METKYENELNMNNCDSFGFFKGKKNLCCSEPKLISCSIYSSNDNEISDNLLNKASNSYSISENNDLFNSLINSKNNKNKELSLLYLINTFGKSYSNESNEKKKIIVDLPKISKNLFSKKSQAKCCSSKNLDSTLYQNNMSIKKYCGKNGIMNSFFSSICEKQMSSGKLISISPKKKGNKKGLIFNSGNRIKKPEITPFSQSNYQFGTLLEDNSDINAETKKTKKCHAQKKYKEKFNSSLLKIDFCDEYINNKFEENKENCV